MRVTISIPGMVAGTVLGAALRYALTVSELHHAGWFWWFQHGLHASPGTAGFAGFVDTDVLMLNYESVEYCLVAALLPGLLGAVIGAASGASGRPVAGAIAGGFFSGLVLLLMRLPELYRPGWFGRLWLDFNVPILFEGAIVGAIVGALAGWIGRLSSRWTQRERASKPPTSGGY